MATIIESTEISSLGHVVDSANNTPDDIKFYNWDNTMLLVRLPLGGSATVSVCTPKQVDDDLAVVEREVVLDTDETLLIGPFDPYIYNNQDGYVTVNVSSSHGHRVEAFHLRRW